MRFHPLENCPSIQDIQSQLTLKWIVDPSNNKIEVIQPIYRPTVKDPSQPLKLTVYKEKR